MITVRCEPLAGFRLHKGLRLRNKAARTDALTTYSSFSEMRDPLPKVWIEFVHAWLIVVSNQNLYARELIREELGRKVEKQRDFSVADSELTALKNILEHSGRKVERCAA